MSKRFGSRLPSDNQGKNIKSASTALSQQIAGITQRIEELAQTKGPAHEYCSRLAAAIVKLQLYSNRLLAERVDEASRMLQIIGDELEEISKGIVADLSTQSQYTLAVSGESTKLHDHTAATLSLAIDEGLRLYAELTDIFQAVKTLRRSVFNAATTWSLDSSNDVLAGQLDWFANGQTGFNAQASRYLIGRTGLDTEINDLIQEAKERLLAIDEYVQRAVAKHEKTRQDANSTLEEQTRFEEILARLENIHGTTTGLPADVIDEILDQSNLLNQQERNDWQRYQTHSDFRNLHKTRVDVSDWLEGTRRLLDAAPKLQKQAVIVLETARRYIQQLEETPEDVAPSPVKRKEQPSMPLPPPPYQEETDRIDEIYQHIIAVAAHQYCSHYYLVGMTVNSILSILVLLDRVSEEESRLYKDAIAQRLEARSITVTDRSKVTETWNTADPQAWDWIYFKPGRMWLWRLVARAKQPGLWLAQQLGISEEALDAACKIHKENQERLHQQWQQKRRKR